MISRRLAFLAALAGTIVPVLAASRPRTETEMPRFEMIEPSPPAPAHSPVLEAASAGTTYFGGTVWDAVDGRWEAMVGGTWTFDSGVASSFSPTVDGLPVEGLNPYKSPVLHTIMEGWVGFDNTFGLQTEFRRLGTSVSRCVGSPYIPDGGSYSLYCGKLPAEGAAACFADSGGYGNAWYLCMELTDLSYSGAGTVTWSFAYAGDTEPGFDYSYAVVDTTGLDDDVVVSEWTGMVFGTASLPLTPGTNMRTTPGPVHFKYCVASDGAYSDEDDLYPTVCGAFTVDNVTISGGGMSYGSDFESDAGGWVLAPPIAGQGGEWSDIVALADLPATKTACPCRLADSVLVFEDLDVGGHGLYQDNLAGSPWIDLDAAGVVGTPGKFVEFDYYYDLPFLNYIYPQINVKWYPYTCPQSGAIMESPWTASGVLSYGYYSGCTTPDVLPYREPFGAKIDADATRVRIALGVLSYCRFYGNCSGTTNTTPWFDNVRFGVFGTARAPAIATRTVDFALDAFPQTGTLSPSAPGRLDSNNVKGLVSPEPGSALGDTLTVQGGGINPLTGVGGTEVQVVFNVRPGPGINLSAFNAWLTKHQNVSRAEVGSRSALGTWYCARMDTAEQGGVQTAARSWMTAYHEAAMGSSGPLFTGPNDMARAGDLDPRGKPRLVNDIFPDDLFTPGTRVNYYYRARYTDETSWFELPYDGDASTFGAQEGTPGYYEWECLPSSMTVSPDTSWNCLLYVDHFDGRGAQVPVETALSVVLPGGSANFEHVRWDRYDVEAPSSQQASLGRPANTQYGATVLQVLGYSGILWNSGNLSAFNVVKEDADVLDPWLTVGPSLGLDTFHRLYLNGDGVAESMTQEQASDASALVLLNDLCGVALRCKTYRDAACNASGATDLTACVDIDPVGTGTPAQDRDPGLVVGEGNGCPQLRSFDVLSVAGATRYNAAVSEDEEYRSPQIPGLTGDFASIAAAQQNPANGPTYLTVVDGVSVHYRRDKSDCGGVSPIQGRLAEVLGWMGLLAPAVCTDPSTGGVGLPAPAVPRFTTALTSLAPNPLVGGSPATIQFTMARDGRADVEIFDVRGRLVRRVFSGPATAGETVVPWDGLDETRRAVAGGVYFARFRALGEDVSRKVVVVSTGGLN